MSDPTLTLSFAAAAETATPSHWVRLEQVMPPEISTYASLQDLHDLWLTAATGRSARSVRATTCPVEFDGATIRLFLGFSIWPSSPVLDFTLAAAMGTLGPLQKIEPRKEFTLFVDNRQAIDLPYYLQGAAVVWETPTFDRFGQEIQPPAWELAQGNSLRFSAEVFGAIRVTGTAVGFSCLVTMELSKPVEEIETPDGYSIYPDDVIIWGVPPVKTVFNAPRIENLENTIAATWLDGEDTEADQLRLLIPPCVKALLAMCPDMYQTIVLLCNTISTQQVYYNACTGKVLSVLDGVDPQKFCVPISGTVTANPWGMGTL